MVVCLAPAPTATAGFGSIVMVSRGGGRRGLVCHESRVFLLGGGVQKFSIEILILYHGRFYYNTLLDNATACC